MKMTKIVLVLAITLLFTPAIQADSMRCGTHVIEDADLHKALSIKEVIKKCGQPSSRKGNKLYYKKKGKRLDFDTNERLMSIHDIEDD
jgi:hypothetical protein